MKKDKSKLLAIFLVLLTIIVVTISFISKRQISNESKINIVIKPSSFFTVNSCLNRVITYISKKDAKSLISTLDGNYIKDNNITEENVLNQFEINLENPTFVSKKMYYQKINQNITKYYVAGILKENILHDYDPVEKEPTQYTYFIVNLDSDNGIFTIEPYNGTIFMDGENNEK